MLSYSHYMVTNRPKHTSTGTLTLKKKAEIIRGHRGAVAGICRITGKSHTLISLALDAKLPDMDAAWLKPILKVIDAKAAELLAADKAARKRSGR
jgi:hypothetical protein